MDADDDIEQDDDGYEPPTHVFYENEHLIRALNDPGRGTNEPGVAQRLIDAIQQATLIALVPPDQEFDVDESGHTTLDRDLSVSFVLVQHPDVEGDIVPLFTDEGTLVSFAQSGGRYIALSSRDLFPLLITAGDELHVVVNPGSPEALLLTPGMVREIVDSIRGVSMEMLASGEKVVVGLPKDPIEGDSLDAVARALGGNVGIVRALQMQWFVPGRHDKPTLVLAVELSSALDDSERRSVLTDLWKKLSPILKPLGRNIEMVDLDGQRKVFGDLVERADAIQPALDSE
jgi:hypothetical protein